MKKNNKGFAEVTVLYVVIAIMGLLFVPNPVSSALGVGVRPNKTVQTQSSVQKVDFLKRDLTGRPVAEPDGSYLTRTTVSDQSSDKDIQQRVGLWEQIRALPVLLMLLMGAGVIFPLFGTRLWALYQRIKKELLSFRTESKKIVKGLDQAFATIAKTLAGEKFPGEIDRAALAKKIEDNMLDVLSKSYDQSTKDLVKTLR